MPPKQKCLTHFLEAKMSHPHPRGRNLSPYPPKLRLNETEFFVPNAFITPSDTKWNATEFPSVSFYPWSKTECCRIRCTSFLIPSSTKRNAAILFGSAFLTPGFPETMECRNLFTVPSSPPPIRNGMLQNSLHRRHQALWNKTECCGGL